MANQTLGRSRRPFCYHKRGISLEDHLDTSSDVLQEFLIHEDSCDHTMDSSGREEDSEEGLDTDCLQNRFGRLLSCEEMADVHFLVGSGRRLRIPAHRLVLAVGSPVFKDMFFGTTEVEEVEEVEETEVEPIAFLEFLRFLYSDQIRLNKDNVLGVLRLSIKYVTPQLERTCIRFIKTELNDKNCFAIWLSAKTSGLREFEELALRVVECFAATVLLGQDFLRADFQSVKELLENDWLRISEEQLFRALMRWAKNECLRSGLCPTRVNIRHVLSNSLDLIRFPLMTTDQIRRTVANEGVLEEEVVRQLLSSHRTWPRVARPVQYNNKVRAFQRLEGQLLTVQRFQSFDNQLPNSGQRRSIYFSVNRSLFVAGVGVYGPRKPFLLSVNLVIRRSLEAVPTIVDKTCQQFLIRGEESEPILNLKLDQPFLVLADTQYTIEATITAADTSRRHFYSSSEVNFYYGTDGVSAAKVKTKDNETIVFNFSWDQVFDDTELMPTSSSSAPPTPNPPPRPPPPKEYRRPSRMERLKRALSFNEKPKESVDVVRDVTSGQIPVIMFYV